MSRAASLLAGLCALVLASVASADTPAVKEHELKAAYIFNFARFTTWPSSSFASPVAPLVIGIMANEQVATAATNVMKNRAVKGHPIEVRSLAPDQSLEGLHVLYLAEGSSRLSVQRAFASPTLLTIGDAENFAASGGIIRLVIEADRLQFEINATAAQRAELTLSSQLLMLARTVRK